MSRTYSIACTECKKHIWVAQGSEHPPTKLIFYSGEREIMSGLEQFLVDHFKHSLVFDDNCGNDIDDYEDVTPE